MFDVIAKVLFWVMTYMFILVCLSESAMKYWCQQQGHQNARYLLSKKHKPKRMDGDPSILTRMLFACYNGMQRIFFYIPGILYINRVFYHLIILVRSHLVVMIASVFLYGGIAMYLFNMPTGVILICIVMMMNLSLLHTQKDYEQSLLVAFLLITDDASYWTTMLAPKFQNDFVFKTSRLKKTERRAMNLKDQSVMNYDYFKEAHVFPNGYRFHPMFMIGFITDDRFQPRSYHTGGISLYNKVDFLKSGKYSRVRSNGMMTVVDYKDIVPVEKSLRYNDEKAAYQIRLRSNVAGMESKYNSGKYFDRTHLVHHRLSGMEGGYGTLVPMFKSVNTGVRPVFFPKEETGIKKGSMKYYEDFAFDYLAKHKKTRILYCATPFYLDQDAIPQYVDIEIYRVKRGNVFLIKKGRVRNNIGFYEQDLKFNPVLDYTTGQLKISK